MSKTKADPNYKVIAENRRARFDYAIENDLECGVVLFGSEVKSMRNGGSNIAESYAQIENGELWLVNSYVAPYEQAKNWCHQGLYGNSNFIFALGLIYAIFFGIIAVSMIQKISEKKAGLVINKQGVTDNSSGLSIGFIPWAVFNRLRF